MTFEFFAGIPDVAGRVRAVAERAAQLCQDEFEDVVIPDVAKCPEPDTLRQWVYHPGERSPRDDVASVCASTGLGFKPGAMATRPR